ncbi:MAG: hypothetical protein K6U00_15390 [Armatimonadetes bacterium]|nr:hypothetical protein [Armatimonadota bacterium]
MVHLVKQLGFCATVLIVLVTGCRDQSANPVGAARLFIVAALSDDRMALMQTVTEESRTLLESSASTTKRGIFDFLEWDIPPKEGVEYVLILLRLEGNDAQVNLRPKGIPSGPFADPRLPRQFKEMGVPILVTKRNRAWKVDLIRTSDMLARIIMEQGQPGSVPPPGWPGMPGMPDPPGSLPPR